MSGGSETGGNYAKGGLALGDPVAFRPVPGERVLAADEVGRALAWIQAHYGQPTFQCPTEPAGDEGGN